MVTGLENSRLSPDCGTCRDEGFVSRIVEEEGGSRGATRDCPDCPRTQEDPDP
jgi:hypothetical protein